MHKLFLVSVDKKSKQSKLTLKVEITIFLFLDYKISLKTLLEFFFNLTLRY